MSRMVRRLQRCPNDRDRGRWCRFEGGVIHERGPPTEAALARLTMFQFELLTKRDWALVVAVIVVAALLVGFGLYWLATWSA
jgi:hypothetical protein